MGEPAHISGALLAGGNSSRMGKDKALLEISGTPLVQRVAGVMQQVCGEVFIVADRGERFEFLGLKIYPDIHKDSGPLGGIHSALHHAETERVLVLSCDVPFLETEVLFALMSVGEGADAVVAIEHSRKHPLCGIYRKKCLPTLDLFLSRGGRAVQEFLTQVNVEAVDISGETATRDVPRLFNVNTPEEYESARLKFKDT